MKSSTQKIVFINLINNNNIAISRIYLFAHIKFQSKILAESETLSDISN